MNIESAHSPVWVNPGHTAIDLMVKFTEFDEELPFTATPNDPNAYGSFLFNNATTGAYGPIAPFVGPAFEQLKLEARAAIIRNRDLKRYAPVTAHGRTWQADPVSKDLLSDSINLAQAGLPLPAVWRDADNSDMPITSLAQLLAIAGAMASQTQAAYSWSWGKKALVLAAATPEELADIDLEN